MHTMSNFLKIFRGFWKSVYYFSFRTLFIYRKDCKFYQNYFRTIDRIAQDPHSIEAYQLKLNYALTTGLLVNYFLDYVFPKETEYDILVHLKFMQIVQSPRISNLELCLVVLEMYYLYWVFYVKLYNNPVMVVFRQVMLHDDTSFALSKKPIRKMTIRVLNIYQPFFIVIGKFSLFHFPVLFIFLLELSGVALVFNLFYRLPLSSMWNWTGLFHISIMLSSVFFLLSVIIQFGYILSFWAAFAVFTACICFERFRYCDSLLAKCDHASNRFRAYLLDQFRREHAITMRYFFTHYKMLGRLLVAFILANSAYNSNIIVTLLFNKQKIFMMAVGLTIFAATQISFIFWIHWLAAYYSDRIARPFKRVMHLNLNTSMKPCVRIKLAAYIQTFFSLKKFGITYGDAGHVSLFAFAKVIDPLLNFALMFLLYSF